MESPQSQPNLAPSILSPLACRSGRDIPLRKGPPVVDWFIFTNSTTTNPIASLRSDEQTYLQYLGGSLATSQFFLTVSH